MLPILCSQLRKLALRLSWTGSKILFVYALSWNMHIPLVDLLVWHALKTSRRANDLSEHYTSSVFPVLIFLLTVGGCPCLELKQLWALKENNDSWASWPNCQLQLVELTVMSVSHCHMLIGAQVSGLSHSWAFSLQNTVRGLSPTTPAPRQCDPIYRNYSYISCGQKSSGILVAVFSQFTVLTYYKLHYSTDKAASRSLQL